MPKKKPEKHMLEVRILKDRDIREAIGAISVHWSVLELMVERAIATLEGNPNVVSYTSDLGHRLEDLKARAKEKLSEDESKKLVTIAGNIATLRHDRHRSIHGLWSLDEKGQLLNTFPRDKTGKIRKPLSMVDLRDIKLRIWRKGIKPLGKYAPFGIPTELASKRK